MNNPLYNVLAPTDFSEAGNNALKVAIELCKQHGAVLHLMYVLESRYIVAKQQSDVKLPGISDDLNQKARKKLYAEYEFIINVHQIPVQIHLTIGIPYDEICKTATEMPIDLIVIGTSGASGGKINAVGTTCYNVVKNAVKAVITIPSNFEFSNFKKILFPIRPVNGVAGKYEFTGRFLGSRKADVYIANLSLEDDQDFFPNDNEELFEIINSRRETDISFTTKSYTCRSYSSKVLELVENLGANLVVINATLYYNWIAFFLGPYTLQIINYSKVPVLSFRTGIDILSNQHTKTKEAKMDKIPLASI